jgi:hypothetical protein
MGFDESAVWVFLTFSAEARMSADSDHESGGLDQKELGSVNGRLIEGTMS